MAQFICYKCQRAKNVDEIFEVNEDGQPLCEECGLNRYA